MLCAHREVSGRLELLPQGGDLSSALWIDLYRPQPEQVARVVELGVPVPSLAEMEEIERSNRLYREAGIEVLTVVLPGLPTTKSAMSGPVSFLIRPGRLLSVRHHAPRPFETFPARAERATAGCSTPRQVFLGLCEDIVARLADLLEGAGATLDCSKSMPTSWGRGSHSSPMPRSA